MDNSTNRDNIKMEYNLARVGLDMDSSVNNITKGKISYALNAILENFDANGVNYQNEPGNELCLEFPEGYIVIGKHSIYEQNKHIFFITNPVTGGCQIGYMINNDCVYHTLVDAGCLNFNINYPIQKVVHRITNCATEIYWTDGYNPRRYLDIDDIPKIIKYGTPLCDPVYTSEVDCNQLNVQPNFTIPVIEITDVLSTGDLKAGAYQFAVQYSDASGNPFTSYYSVTNPVPIGNNTETTPNFDYPVGKSIAVRISNLDTTGMYQHFNLAVIKTVNAISSVELVGTYFIEEDNRSIVYTGQNVTNQRLSMNDIFEKYPYYDIADDLTTAQDILIWSKLTSIERINYQRIANQIDLEWETYRIPADENYADELNAANLRGYLRDEVYAFEIQFLLCNGKETDGFHIPGREITPYEKTLADIPDTDEDFIGEPTYYNGDIGYSPYWKIYNTAVVKGFSSLYSADSDYKGAYQYGDFGYWESTEEYPCNEDVWGELAGQKIRHHKFPDASICPIYESRTFIDQWNMTMEDNAVFPIGVKVNPTQVQALIDSSDLTQTEKDAIVGFKILRGDRSTNKSIVAKGMLRNVNSYEKEGKNYYFPNYPYNDLREDPFINSTNNAYKDICDSFEIVVEELYPDPNDWSKNVAKIQYTDCNTNKTAIEVYEAEGTYTLCSIGKPTFVRGTGTVSYSNYDEWIVRVGKSKTFPSLNCAGWRVEWNDITEGIKEDWINKNSWKHLYCVVGTKPDCIEDCEGSGFPGGCDDKVDIKFLKSVINAPECVVSSPLSEVTDRYRQIFNSPETSFGQPFLGDILKLEGVMYGAGKAHFTEVRDNAKYKLVSAEAQQKALDSSAILGGLTDDFNVSAMFAAYQAYLTIYINGITRKNYAYSFNSIASYDYMSTVPDGEGIKQRNIDKAKYLIPQVVSVDSDNVNNWQRESSVYIKTDEDKTALPFPDDSTNIPVIEEHSRFTISEAGNCNAPGEEEDIRVVAYYASMKKDFINQWGTMYSYDTIDTGYTYIFNSEENQLTTVFGGDTFISRFAFKTKLPFFIDNRVNAPDDSDIFYDEIGNVGYPKYWHSARSVLEDYTVPPNKSDDSPGTLVNIISYKAHNFDCPNDTSFSYSTGTTSTTMYPYAGIVEEGDSERTFYDGYFYLFAYGIPNFYCETSYNLDLRQAFNNREGDFWPHVSNSIPDDWLQESFVSIANDNTYYYNPTFSKQNKENHISHLPPEWEEKLCYTYYPFRSIYSDKESDNSDNRVNTWKIYRALSYFDFPQNYGDLTSLDGIQNRAILVRFENKTLLYGNLLTIDTSNPQAAYMGNPKLFNSDIPPVDFADTDLGYVGSQHKFLLKVPQGQITVDAKRGHIFLISGTKVKEISGFGSGLDRFLTDHLPFEILKYFPDYETTIDDEKITVEGVDIDNPFKGIGIIGVYDSKYERIIITKLDYIPITDEVQYDYDNKEFYIEAESGERQTILLSDRDYFCNKSWTLSFNMNTGTWISFHTYLPAFYIAENNFFYSEHECCGDFEFIAGELPSTFDCELDGACKLDGEDWDCRLDGYCEYRCEDDERCDLDGECWDVSQDCELEGECDVDWTVTTTTTNPCEVDGYCVGPCDLDGWCEELDHPYPECDFEGECYLVTTTTTSTTCIVDIELDEVVCDDLTTTTTTMFGCYVWGYELEIICDDITTTTTSSTTSEPTTTTTSTTFCSLSSGYDEEGLLFTMGRVGGSPFYDFTSSLEDACQALYDFHYNGGSIAYPYHAVSKDWLPGDNVYDEDDCGLIPSGYYILELGWDKMVVYINPDGTIDSYPSCPTTTSTSTVAPTTTTSSSTLIPTTTTSTTPEPPYFEDTGASGVYLNCSSWTFPATFSLQSLYQIIMQIDIDQSEGLYTDIEYMRVTSIVGDDELWHNGSKLNDGNIIMVTGGVFNGDSSIDLKVLTEPVTKRTTYLYFRIKYSTNPNESNITHVRMEANCL